MTDRRWRVGIWCAVSSKPQATEDKSSLQDQEAAGRRFAATVGEAVAVYLVPGHSRTMWRWEEAERQMPAYRELRQDVEANRIDVLWCLESSRLGRDAALVQQVVSLLESHGAELWRADAPHELGQRSTSHRFLDAFGSVIAQQEGERITERMERGMRNRARRGLFSPSVPHGYVKSEGGYEQDEGADAVREITRLYLEGHSINEIRRRMDASGHPPPRGLHWVRQTIANICNNDAYAGYPHWRDSTCPEPSRYYEAIWTAETHAAIIRERERRYSGPYVRSGASPLTGVAVCARCGYRMNRTVHNETGHAYLRCTLHSNRWSVGGDRECHGNFVREDAALATLAQYVKALGTDDTIDRILARRQDQQQADESAEELDRLSRQLADLDSRRERLALAFAAGDMALAYYRRADDALAAQQDTAGRRGVVYEHRHAFGAVRKGELICHIVDPFTGRIVEECRAPMSGVLYTPPRGMAACEKGERLFAISMARRVRTADYVKRLDAEKCRRNVPRNG